MGINLITPSCLITAPKAGKSLYSEPKPRKRERVASSSSSFSNESGSEMSVSTVMSGASSDHKKRRHHKDRRRGKKGKDYSRKRGMLKKGILIMPMSTVQVRFQHLIGLYLSHSFFLIIVPTNIKQIHLIILILTQLASSIPSCIPLLACL